MTEDKKTLGLTAANRNVVEQIMERGFFEDQIDAAKFSMSLAIKNDVKPGDIEGAETVWNIGSFDPDGEIRDLIKALYPDTEIPYRLIEFFINAGLELIENYFKSDKYFDLEELIKQ